MTQEAIEKLHDIELYVGEMAHARNEIEEALLDIDIRQRQLIESESKIYKAAYAIRKELSETPSAEPWHPASEAPEHTDGWFLALTKDNLPFLTHYIKGWLPQVYMWKYIDIPTDTL